MTRSTMMFYKIWRRRFRNFMRRFNWYKRRFARNQLRALPAANLRAGVDLEEDLYMMGPAIAPQLDAAIRDPEVNPLAKQTAVRVLAAFGQVENLEIIELVATRAQGTLGETAVKSMYFLCRKLDRDGELPAQYIPWLTANQGKKPTESPIS